MKKYILLLVLYLVIYPGAYAQWDIYVAKYKDNKKSAISYTFDDGLVEHYSLVMPKFRDLSFSGTFWINGSKINTNPAAIKDTTRMTCAQLKEMSDMGHEISNHGWAHKNFSRFPIEDIRVDIEKNDSAIFEWTGKMPITFCYPNNNKKKEAMNIAVINRVDTRTFQRSIGSKSTPADLKKWTDRLIETGDWGVGMTHGITYGYDAFLNPQRFWDHLDYVKSLEKYIWVATFCQVGAYKKEYDAVSLETSVKGNRMIIKPSIDLDKNLFKELLTLVIKNKDNKNIKNAKIKQGRHVLKPVISVNTLIVDFDPFG